MPFLRRLAFAPVVLVVIAAATYGTRVLRPDLYPGEGLVSGTWRDLDRVFFHLDFGCAVILRGCPPIHDMWRGGLAYDVWLLAGALVIGTAGGILTGVWCAGHSRTCAGRTAAPGEHVPAE